MTTVEDEQPPQQSGIMGKVQKRADGRMWNMCGIQKEFKLNMDHRCGNQYATTPVQHLSADYFLTSIPQTFSGIVFRATRHFWYKNI